MRVLSAFVVVTASACSPTATSETLRRPETAAVTADAVAANAVVIAIVDGDTIDAEIDVNGRRERIRLTGIDTPEIAHRDGDIDECYGPEATHFLATILPTGTPVRLERDVVGRDDYGRVLAYVYRASDGVFVNLELVRTGHAQPLSIEPNTVHAEAMVDAARAAERGDRGLWAACTG
jgi:micrococcal nuclease